MNAPKLILVLGALLAGNLAVADSEFFPDEVDWKVSTYLWGMGLEGDIGIGDIVAPMDMDFGDILDVFRGGGSVILRADKGAHGFVADISYFRLAPDDVQLPTGGTVDPRLDITLVEGSYFHKKPTASGFWGIGGGFRYWDADLKLGLSGGFLELERKEGDDWIDGFIGIGGARRINDQWSFIWNGDVAAGDSDSSYTVFGLFQRKLKNGNMVSFGARYWAVDYEGAGGDSGKFLMDVDMAGVMLGYTFD